MEMQPEPTLVELIRYNNWANAQVFAACQALTPEQLAATMPGAYGSIHRTLGHIVAAEADYIHRLNGEGPRPPFRWEDAPAVGDIVRFSETVAGALLKAVQQVHPNHIVHEEEDGNTIDYQASLLFIQVINHGIEHRTNITTILTGMGLPAPEVDGWGFLFSHPDRFALKETFQESPHADNLS
jgi:uncharacterized damage-inducible protein DinB